MIFSLALLLAATAEQVVLVDEVFRVPSGSLRAIDVGIREAAVVDCRFSVLSGGPGVRLVLVPPDEVDAFRDREGHQVLASTPVRRSGVLRFRTDRATYSLVLDNRLEERGPPSQVRLTVSVRFGPPAAQAPREISPQRRAIVIAISLAFFFGVALFAGRKLRRALERRPPPNF
jgi:hypothetical protein